LADPVKEKLALDAEAVGEHDAAVERLAQIGETVRRRQVGDGVGVGPRARQNIGDVPCRRRGDRCSLGAFRRWADTIQHAADMGAATPRSNQKYYLFPAGLRAFLLLFLRAREDRFSPKSGPSWAKNAVAE